jgi:hypothetical protein
MDMASMQSESSLEKLSRSVMTFSYDVCRPAASTQDPSPPPNCLRASCSWPTLVGPACDSFRSRISSSTRCRNFVNDDSSVDRSWTASLAVSKMPDSQAEPVAPVDALPEPPLWLGSTGASPFPRPASGSDETAPNTLVIGGHSRFGSCVTE